MVSLNILGGSCGDDGGGFVDVTDAIGVICVVVVVVCRGSRAANV